MGWISSFLEWLRGDSEEYTFKSGFSFSQRSLRNLDGVHPDLVKLAKRALELSSVDFGITEGVRSVKRQQQLFAEGVTPTMVSTHFVQDDGFGHAIDVMAYIGSKGTWNESYYHKIDEAFEEASEELNIPYEWGGNFQSYFDGVHFNLAKHPYRL